MRKPCSSLQLTATLKTLEYTFWLLGQKPHNAFRELETLAADQNDRDRAAFCGSVPGALETLKAGITKAGPALEVSVAAAGHAHVDVALDSGPNAP